MSDAWRRFLAQSVQLPAAGLSLDLSTMGFSEEQLAGLDGPVRQALEAMDRLEAGALANASENRMVGHYWLRSPELAPEPLLSRQIESTGEAVRRFCDQVRRGEIMSPEGEQYRHVLFAGIGGSALGPQLLAHALRDPRDYLQPHFLDNTDPHGFHRTFDLIGGDWPSTLAVITSKSGGTQETANAALAIRRLCAQAGVDFPGRAVAITGEGSRLDRQAVEENWLARFPMWDWVGGRTSIASAVGLIPAGLMGLPIDEFLSGMRRMDTATREPHWRRNPAALLAAAWFLSGGGRGDRNMVVLPYCDRLELFSRYLQQLIMESLGKRTDRQGRVVHQGLTVLGNKGSTDQHAFVQQLRDGRDDFFATFIQVLDDGDDFAVDGEIQTGDYLFGFLAGTRQALAEEGRPSLTLTVERLDAAALGGLIALFERAAGLYAELIDINAYDQPGVEAGKRAAGAVIELQRRLMQLLDAEPRTAEELAGLLGAGASPRDLYDLLLHLSTNGRRGIVVRDAGDSPAADRFHRP